MSDNNVRKVAINTTINGQEMDILVDPYVSLLETLREVVGMTGTKEGCNDGNCGACTINIDGRIVDSCLVLGVEAEGKNIETVEGMATPESGTGKYYNEKKPTAMQMAKREKMKKVKDLTNQGKHKEASKMYNESVKSAVDSLDRILKKKSNLGEEGYDIARDQGKVKPSKDKKDATTMPPSEEMKKTQKVNKGPSAAELVKQKYGKSIMGIK